MSLGEDIPDYDERVFYFDLLAGVVSRRERLRMTTAELRERAYALIADAKDDHSGVE